MRDRNLHCKSTDPCSALSICKPGMFPLPGYPSAKTKIIRGDTAVGSPCRSLALTSLHGAPRLPDSARRMDVEVLPCRSCIEKPSKCMPNGVFLFIEVTIREARSGPIEGRCRAGRYSQGHAAPQWMYTLELMAAGLSCRSSRPASLMRRTTRATHARYLPPSRPPKTPPPYSAASPRLDCQSRR